MLDQRIPQVFTLIPGNGNQQHRNGGSHIVVEKEDGLGLALGVLMTGFEGMRMHNDNSVHHM